MSRHGDDDGDGVVNQADPDWQPDTLDDDFRDHPRFSRVGDGEPDRWPEPSPEELQALGEAAAAVDPDWLHLACQPIEPPDGPHVLERWEDVPS